MYPTRRPNRALAALAVCALALTAAACGDDDDSDDSTAPVDAEPAAVDFCDAALAIDVAPGPDVDFDTATEDEIAAAIGEWATTVMRPLADDVVASAPDEVADEVEVLSSAVDEMAAGAPEAFDSPDAQRAGDAYDPFVDQECGWTVLDVTTVDYAIDGIPDDLDAGPTRLRVTNEGTELHEVFVLKRNPGSDMPVEELFELSEEEAFGHVTPAGDPVVVPPGEDDMGVYDLEDGSYIALCMIPTGITGPDSVPAPDALPHAAHGMVTEFTVS